jgi:hypothetical protein
MAALREKPQMLPDAILHITRWTSTRIVEPMFGDNQDDRSGRIVDTEQATADCHAD